jgi:endonuclease/exonuclease/phosphatase family metal-dependent hydrolase
LVIKQTFAVLLFPLALCAGGKSLSVVTLNLAKEGSVARMADELHANRELAQADVFLLQEAAGGAAEGLAEKLWLHVATSPAAPGTGDHLAILSRYPLREVRVRPLRRFDLVFHTRSRFALSATADTPWGSVRILNTHLDTRINAADRLAQLDAVVRDAGGGPAILGGDFNSNRFYWIDHVVPLPGWRSQAASVEDYMTRAGYRTAVPRSATTFDYLGQHLDWIWLRGMATTASRVYPLKFSDHHACWARVAM